MDTVLTVEERDMISVFASRSRIGVIGEIEMILPYLDGLDVDELSRRVIRKLWNMTDEEFERLGLAEE